MPLVSLRPDRATMVRASAPMMTRGQFPSGVDLLRVNLICMLDAFPDMVPDVCTPWALC